MISLADKLFRIFEQKRRSLIFSKLPASMGDPKCVKRWTNYIKKIKGAEYIEPKESSMCDSDSLGQLLKIINDSPNFEKFVIRLGHNEFVVVEKELANKILVLGDLPP